MKTPSFDKDIPELQELFDDGDPDDLEENSFDEEETKFDVDQQHLIPNIAPCVSCDEPLTNAV